MITQLQRIFFDLQRSFSKLKPIARSGKSRLYQPGDGWDVAMTSVGISRDQGDQPRLVVAGGKGVGKSTFVRWLVNSLLERSRVMPMMIT